MANCGGLHCSGCGPGGGKGRGVLVLVLLGLLAVGVAAARAAVHAVAPTAEHIGHYVVLGAEIAGGLVGGCAVLGLAWVLYRIARALHARAAERARLAPPRPARGLDAPRPRMLPRRVRGALGAPSARAIESPRVHVITRVPASRKGARR